MLHSAYTENLHTVNKTGVTGDHIRLLRTRPLQGGFNKICELKTFSLKTAPLYAALSYSWGTEPREALLAVKNGHAIVHMNITFDLYDALERVARPPGQDLWFEWLWVDQICINQDNDLEKSYQVGKMKEIYSTAESVIVWLGKEMPDRDYEGAIDQLPYGGLTKRKIRHLHDQGHRVWWNRLWVMQEIVFSKVIYVCIGWQSQPWKRFVDTSSHIIPSIIPSGCGVGPISGRPRIDILDRLRYRLGRMNERYDLLDLLRETSPSGVSNELDRVYALLSLASTDWRENIPIEYGIPLQTLCARIARHAISRDGNFDVLFSNWPLSIPGFDSLHSSIEWTSWPRWLPKFCDEPQSSNTSIAKSQVYHAGTFAKPQLTLEYGAALSMLAISYDFVEWTYPDRSLLVSDVQNLHTGKWSSRETASLRKQDGIGIYQNFEELLRSVIDKRKLRSPVCAQSWKVKTLEELINLSGTRGKNWFRTSRGHVGFASQKVAKDDEIIIPYGARVPFVVRTEHLIADCYVFGVMDGQLLGDGLLKTKTYTLR